RTSTDLVQKARWEFPSFARHGNGAAGTSSKEAEAFDPTPEDLEALMAQAFERYFHTSGLFGTPEGCLSMVESLREIGVDEIACLVDFGVEPDAVLEGLTHLNRLRELSNPRRPSEGGWD